jgi:translation initiation factor 2D
MNKLFGGADLMTPGLANGPPFPAGATKGAVVAVASLDKPTVPQFVGLCEIDVAALGEVQGVKGHAVRGVHWEGDELWAWSSTSRPGQAAPEHLEGWDNQVEDVEAGVDDIRLAEKESDVPSQDEGGVPLGEGPGAEQDDISAEPEKEPTTKGMNIFPFLFSDDIKFILTNVFFVSQRSMKHS